MNPSSSRKQETRGRPAMTGDYVGLAEAKERLNAAKREELRLAVVAGDPAVVGAGDRPVSFAEVSSLLDRRLMD